MIRSATDIIRGLYHGAKGASNYFKPIVGSVLRKGSHLFSKVPGFLSEAKETTDTYLPYVKDFVELYRGIRDPHDIKAPTIGPSPNAAFGVGTLGPRDPAPAFIGDDQEDVEYMERIMHNPYMKKQRVSPEYGPRIMTNFPQPQPMNVTIRHDIKEELKEESKKPRKKRTTKKSSKTKTINQKPIKKVSKKKKSPIISTASPDIIIGEVSKVPQKKNRSFKVAI